MKEHWVYFFLGWLSCIVGVIVSRVLRRDP
jgi:hypothetical protein